MKQIVLFVFAIFNWQTSFASCTKTVVCAQGMMETCTAVASIGIEAQCLQYDKVLECRETDQAKNKKSSIYICCDVSGRALSTRDPHHANGICMYR